jgi:uncharacterized protein
MAERTRFYDSLLRQHFAKHRQMALVSGPRQVGKTTTCRTEGTDYLNWDNTDDRRVILRGPAAVAERIGLEKLRTTPPILVLDELHRHARWKAFLKGFFDVYGKQVRVTVTGSSRLDVFRRGGDSLMGRYFLYRMHPFSVGECLRTEVPEEPIRPPAAIERADWQALWEHGGFPEPFIRRDAQFTRRWRSLRLDQLTKEDIRAVTQIQELSALEALSHILAERSSQQLIYSNLANEIGVAIDTIRRWVDVFERMHFGFLIRPWFANVTKALRKEPKWFLRDWSGIEDPGARAEGHGRMDRPRSRPIRTALSSRQAQTRSGFPGRARPETVVSRGSEVERRVPVAIARILPEGDQGEARFSGRTGAAVHPGRLFRTDRSRSRTGQDVPEPDSVRQHPARPRADPSADRNILQVLAPADPYRTDVSSLPEAPMTNPIWSGAAVALTLLTAVSLSLAAPTDDVATLAALDTQYQEAVKKNDATTMARILHDDFILVLGDGKTYTKTDLLESARKRAISYELQDEEPGTQKVRVWGDTAVVTAKLLLKGTQKGAAFDRKLWFSDTYVRTPGGWRYVFGQASLALPPED